MARKAHHFYKLYITIDEINHCFTRRWHIHVKQNDLPRLNAIKAKIAEKKTKQSSGFDGNRTKLSETGRVPPPVEPRNRMLGPSQHYIFLVQNYIARENVIFFNTKFIFLVHNYIPSTNFIFVVETIFAPANFYIPLQCKLLSAVLTFLYHTNFTSKANVSILCLFGRFSNSHRSNKRCVWS